MSAGLAAELSRLGQLTDGRIRRALDEHVSATAGRLRAMLEYHLGWRGSDLLTLEVPAPAGKKLRPALAMLVCDAVSGSEEAALPAAASVELIHNFSLIHDDIQDRSELRRHRPTVWSLWAPRGSRSAPARTGHRRR